VLPDLQRTFRIAVTGTDDAGLAALVAARIGGGASAATRIDVYRTNVQESLIDVLATAFPVVGRIVGPAYFRGLAAGYVAAQLPRVPQLSVYGDGFADFLAGHEAAVRLPYLPDVARLEWARGEAYFAADAPPLDPAALRRVAPESLAALRLVPHPALRLVASAHPIRRIWEVNQPEVTDVPALDLSLPEQVAITRPEHSVVMRGIGAGDLRFVQGLVGGAGLADAAGAALDADPEFDLQRCLEGHLVHGSFAAFA
jgi:hypothetical protein